MAILRIILFIIFVLAILTYRQWLPSSTPAVAVIETGIPEWADIDDKLLIDNRAVLSVTSLQNVTVLDGDSVRWNGTAGPVEFRLASIDAPEWRQPYGQQAKQYLKLILTGKELTAYQTDTDRFGRKIAFLFANPIGRPEEAIEINAKMIADGYAWHAIKHSSNPNLANLESNARSARLGLWKNPNPRPPWEFRDLEKQQRFDSAKLGQ